MADPTVRALATIAERMVRDLTDHATARQMQAEVNRLASGAQALDNAAANRNPLDTPAAHALKVAKMARRLDSEITATLNRSSEILRAGLKDVQRRIDEKIDLTPNAFAQEIRSRFYSMNGKDRAKFIHELVDRNNGPELAAIVRAPAILTGISDEQRAAYEKMIVTKHAGAEYDEQGKLGEVFEGVMAATRTAGNFVKSLTDPSTLAKIEREAAAADAAGAAFDQSLQQ